MNKNKIAVIVSFVISFVVFAIISGFVLWKVEHPEYICGVTRLELGSIPELYTDKPILNRKHFYCSYSDDRKWIICPLGTISKSALFFTISGKAYYLFNRRQQKAVVGMHFNNFLTNFAIRNNAVPSFFDPEPVDIEPEPGKVFIYKDKKVKCSENFL